MNIDYKDIFWILSIILVILWNYTYIISIFKGKTKPHIYTKIVWTILMWIWFIIQFNNWWWSWAWMLWASTLSEWFQVILCLKYWTKDITKFDTIILILALTCIPLYLWIEDKHYSLYAVIFIDMLWSLPMFRKTLNDPFSEDIKTWNIFTLKNIFSILALQNYTILTILYPFIMTLFNIVLIITMLILRKTFKEYKN